MKVRSLCVIAVLFGCLSMASATTISINGVCELVPSGSDTAVPYTGTLYISPTFNFTYTEPDGDNFRVVGFYEIDTRYFVDPIFLPIFYARFDSGRADCHAILTIVFSAEVGDAPLFTETTQYADTFFGSFYGSQLTGGTASVLYDIQGQTASSSASAPPFGDFETGIFTTPFQIGSDHVSNQMLTHSADFGPGSSYGAYIGFNQFNTPDPASLMLFAVGSILLCAAVRKNRTPATAASGRSSARTSRQTPHPNVQQLRIRGCSIPAHTV
jgi:hypothetical protein